MRPGPAALRGTAALALLAAACGARGLAPARCARLTAACPRRAAAPPRGLARAAAEPPDDDGRSAYREGQVAVQELVRERERDPEPKFVASTVSKPMGITFAPNPGGKGVYVSALDEGSAEGEQKLQSVCLGDYLVSVEALDVTRMSLDEVLELLDEAPLLVNIGLQRGGSEPWRAVDGLSVDEMMAAVLARYPDALSESDQAQLYRALQKLKEDEAAGSRTRGDAPQSATARGLERLSLEVRSFVAGLRVNLRAFVDGSVDKAAVDLAVALRTAEYLVRRAAMDSGRLLSQGSRAVARLAAAEGEEEDEAEGASGTPFRELLKVPALTAVLGEPAGVELPRPTAGTVSSVNASRELLAVVLEEVASAVERGASAEASARARAAEEEALEPSERAALVARAAANASAVDWARFERRANNLGGALGADLSRALSMIRSDYEAFEVLKREQISLEPIPGEQLLEGGRQGLLRLRADGRLSSFARSREEQARRAQSDSRRATATFAAKVGERGLKDSADTVVYGVMPGAKVVGKAFAKSVAENVAERFGARGSRQAGGDSSVSADLSAASAFIGSVAQQLGEQYRADLAQGSKSGPLGAPAPAAPEVAEGPTTMLRSFTRTLTGAVRTSLSSAAEAAERERARLEQAQRELSQGVPAAQEAAARPPTAETAAPSAPSQAAVSPAAGGTSPPFAVATAAEPAAAPATQPAATASIDVEASAVAGAPAAAAATAGTPASAAQPMAGAQSSAAGAAPPSQQEGVATVQSGPPPPPSGSAARSEVVSVSVVSELSDSAAPGVGLRRDTAEALLTSAAGGADMDEDAGSDIDIDVAVSVDVEAEVRGRKLSLLFDRLALWLEFATAELFERLVDIYGLDGARDWQPLPLLRPERNVVEFPTQLLFEVLTLAISRD